MSSQILRLSDLSWVEVEALDKNRTCVLIPLSPLEEHGPHLPLGTDIFGAADIAKTAARLSLEQNPSLQPLLTPAIPLGCAGITADFPGTISLRGQTLYNLLVDFCTGLARSGFRFIMIVNHHLDSIHLKAILEAIDTVSDSFQVRIIETAGRILYSGMELEELQETELMGLSMKTEVHADVRETSYITYRYPHLLKMNPEELPAVCVDVREGLSRGLATFRSMGADLGYIGSPALASASLGRIHLEEQARITAEMLARLVEGRPLPEMSPRILRYLREQVRL